ncbi:hypothetical protein L1887_53629 [Cichorium endivia]|nr:hypothetical protein L1887_53629 [Cichorium endivia]
MQSKGLLSPQASISVEDGGFESFDAGNDNDAVVVAQAWHWCQDWDGALKQVAYALRAKGNPGAHLEPRGQRGCPVGRKDPRSALPPHYPDYDPGRHRPRPVQVVHLGSATGKAGPAGQGHQKLPRYYARRGARPQVDRQGGGACGNIPTALTSSFSAATRCSHTARSTSAMLNMNEAAAICFARWEDAHLLMSWLEGSSDVLFLPDLRISTRRQRGGGYDETPHQMSCSPTHPLVTLQKCRTTNAILSGEPPHIVVPYTDDEEASSSATTTLLPQPQASTSTSKSRRRCWRLAVLVGAMLAMCIGVFELLFHGREVESLRAAHEQIAQLKHDLSEQIQGGYHKIMAATSLRPSSSSDVDPKLKAVMEKKSVIVLKTGSSVAYDRLPVQLLLAQQALHPEVYRSGEDGYKGPQLLLYSDAELHLGEFEVHNALANVSDYVRKQPDFARQYAQLQNLLRDDDLRESQGVSGWVEPGQVEVPIHVAGCLPPSARRRVVHWIRGRHICSVAIAIRLPRHAKLEPATDVWMRIHPGSQPGAVCQRWMSIRTTKPNAPVLYADIFDHVLPHKLLDAVSAAAKKSKKGVELNPMLEDWEAFGSGDNGVKKGKRSKDVEKCKAECVASVGCTTWFWIKVTETDEDGDCYMLHDRVRVGKAYKGTGGETRDDRAPRGGGPTPAVSARSTLPHLAQSQRGETRIARKLVCVLVELERRGVSASARWDRFRTRVRSAISKRLARRSSSPPLPSSDLSLIPRYSLDFGDALHNHLP